MYVQTQLAQTACPSNSKDESSDTLDPELHTGNTPKTMATY